MLTINNKEVFAGLSRAELVATGRMEQLSQTVEHLTLKTRGNKMSAIARVYIGKKNKPRNKR